MLELMTHPWAIPITVLLVVTLICAGVYAWATRVDTSEIDDPDSPWGSV